ncbi:MAG TPA: putative collagen-binding domain-containing protein, partial [Flavisolibacter sp.]
GEKYNYLVASRGNDYALIYNYTGRPFEVVMGKLEGKNVNTSWYSPRDGSTKVIARYPNKGIRSFDPPGATAEGNDWVLVLESEN